MTVDASRLGQSGKVRGSFSVRFDSSRVGLDYNVQVECMVTEGNRVAVGGHYKLEGEPEYPTDYYAFLVIEDNGETGDLISLVYGEIDCADALRIHPPDGLVDSGGFTLGTGRPAKP